MKGFVPGRMVAVGMERSMWTCGNLGVDWVMRQEHANENSQILECNMECQQGGCGRRMMSLVLGVPMGPS